MLLELNDTKKISTLYSLYEHKMYYVAFSILHDEGQAEDAVQEAFLKLIQNENKIKEVNSYATKEYIIQTIRNTAIDIYRKNKKIAEGLQLLDNAGEYDETSFLYEEKEAVENILNRLPERYKSIIQLRYVEEMSVKETASTLGLTETTVRKRCERGLKMLKNKIGGNEYEKFRRI